MLTYCKRCVMPDTKPDLHLNEHGICNACRSYEARKAVDWDARYQELLKVLSYDQVHQSQLKRHQHWLLFLLGQ